MRHHSILPALALAFGLIGLLNVPVMPAAPAAAADQTELAAAQNREVSGCPAAYQTCKSICVGKIRERGACLTSCRSHYQQCLARQGQ